MSIGQPEPDPELGPGARLVGDVGGTNARFAIVTAAGRAPSHVRTLACADHRGIEEAIRAYLGMVQLPLPDLAAIGIASPIDGDRVSMTNHHWAFSVEKLRASLGLTRLRVINDFSALAMSLPELSPSERRQIGAGTALAHHAIGLLGAGTGLGISGLIWCGEHHVPLAGEGGHITLPAGNAREAEIIAVLREHYGHVSAERVLSGPGMVALHDAIVELAGGPPQRLTSTEISTRALAGTCPACTETLHTFCALLGTVAGDLALTLGARGGVYVGGGIVPRLGAYFATSPFRARFEHKGRYAHYLASIPTYVIEAPFPALLGAARALDFPLSLGWDARAEPALNPVKTHPPTPLARENGLPFADKLPAYCQGSETGSS